MALIRIAYIALLVAAGIFFILYLDILCVPSLIFLTLLKHYFYGNFSIFMLQLVHDEHGFASES